MVNREKLCPNLSFDVENKMENLYKAGHISKVSSNFKNLSINWDKYVFRWEKWNFEPNENSAHTAEVLTYGKALLILLPLYLQMLKMLISTQTDNHTKESKKFCNGKKYLF